ncbi:MAG: hypothetical protein WBV82_08610 [Myxococcaceae bacterium]
MRRGLGRLAVLAFVVSGMGAGAEEPQTEEAQDPQEVIIVVTPEYADVERPMLLVPRMMAPVDIPVEDDDGSLRSSYGETKKAPTGKRLPIRKNFTPELQDSAMEQ